MTSSNLRIMGPYVLLALAMATLGAEASIYKYKSKYVSFVYDAFGSAFVQEAILGQEAMLTSTQEALQKWGNGSEVAPGTWNGQSRIEIAELTVTRPYSVAQRYKADAGVTGVVQVAIWEQQDADKLGHPTAHGVQLCCTEALAMETGCPLNSIILRRGEVPGWPKLLNMTFLGNSVVARPEVPSVTIEQTGYYTMSIWACADGLAYATVEGQVSWKNPTGYLPQQIAPVLPLRCVLVIAYTAVLLRWLKACCARGSKLPEVPAAACSVAVMGFLDAVLRLAYTTAMNASGWQPSLWALVIAVFFISVWQGMSRITMLLAAGGGDVLPQELDPSPNAHGRYKAFTMRRLASVYTAAAFLALWNSSIAPGKPSTVAFCLWFLVLDISIFVGSLSRLLKTLRSLRELNHPKLSIYKWLLALLVANEICFGAAFGMGAFLGSWREWTHNKYWRYEWLLAGGCEIIYNFFLTLAISLLFWPRQPSGGAERQLLLTKLDDIDMETQGLCSEDVERPQHSVQGSNLQEHSAAVGSQQLEFWYDVRSSEI